MFGMVISFNIYQEVAKQPSLFAVIAEINFVL
jgi:hypothetical protein